MGLIDTLLSSLLFIVPLIHLVVAPHTKVEESFNLQAAHDILVYGTPTHDIHERFTAAYDHFTFPGAVPRTFIGAVVLSGVSQPLILLAGFQHAQFIVRAVLGAFNAGCLLVFKDALRTAYGKGVARWWIVLLVSQFHAMFYLSRTLPNMFAFGITTLAFAFLLPKSSEAKAGRRRRQAIACLTFSAVVFRSEIAILLATTGLYLLISRHMTLSAMIPAFLVSFIGSLLISVPIDSYFWQNWLWPELAGFYYNAILGSSSNWGVSPWYYYFNALIQLLLNPLALVFISLALHEPATSRAARQLTIPSLLFVAIYSIQPHKEARFIFYVIPPLTASAALCVNFVTSRQDKGLVARLSTFSIVGSVLLTVLASTAKLLLSALNYPGGDALVQLQSLLANDTSLPGNAAVSSHADVFTCMTGLTLFGQNPLGLPLALASADTTVGPDLNTRLLLVDKTEKNITLGWPQFWNSHEYALEENPALPLGDWEVLGTVHGLDGIQKCKPHADCDNGEQEKQLSGEENVLGLGATVADIRRTVRKYTGGWWIGPKMAPRIRIMKKFERVPMNTN